MERRRLTQSNDALLDSVFLSGAEELRFPTLDGTEIQTFVYKPDDFDPATDFQGYTEQAPKANEWNDLMMTYQQKVKEAGPEDWWTPGKLVFDSEWF